MWTARIEEGFEGVLQEVCEVLEMEGMGSLSCRFCRIACMMGKRPSSSLHPSLFLSFPSTPPPQTQKHTQALPPVAAQALELEDGARHFIQAVASPLVQRATTEVCLVCISRVG